MHSWVSHYDLILFDLDGLLVDSELLHFAAFREVMGSKGIALPWSFSEYSQRAHFTRTGLREAAYREFPQLAAIEPSWDQIVAERKAAYMKLLQRGELSLMPGVESLLDSITSRKILSCVVTNSPAEQVERLQRDLPALTQIPHWITREAYRDPKPAPDGYLEALGRYAPHEGAKVIGFEDSARGLEALSHAHVPGVLICAPDLPQVEWALARGALYVPSFHSLESLTQLTGRLTHK